MSGHRWRLLANIAIEKAREEQTVQSRRGGDIYYRTVQRYPGLPDVEDQVSSVATSAAVEKPGSKDKKKLAANLGVNAGRDGSTSPRMRNVDK